MVFKTEYLLSSAAVILSLISAYTTAEGFYLMWNDKTLLLLIIAYAFAIAMACVLIFCCLKVQSYFREGKGIALVTVFFIFASLSMFFNFNSIHGNFTKASSLKNDVKNLNLELTELQLNATMAIQAKFEVIRKKEIFDSLNIAANREADDLFRPGRKEKWRNISLKLAAAEAEYHSAESESKPHVERIAGIFEKASSLIDLRRNITENNLEEATELYNQMGSIVISIIPNFIFSAKKPQSRSGSPDYSLLILQRYYRGDSSLLEGEKSAIQLSLFISFLLDFPVFIATAMLNWRSNKRKKNLFEGDDSRAETRRDKNKVKWI